nr:hypothetical protein [Tanacetum cinerariifolium]
NVADEAVIEEMYDSLERATTTTTGLDVEHDKGNISKTQSKATPNEPSSPRTSLGGGPRHQDTTGDTIAQTRILNVETTKTAQAKEIANLKKRVKRMERKRRSRTHGLKRLYKVRLSARVESSANEESLGKEDTSKQERIYDIDANQDIYLVNVHKEEDIFGVNDPYDTSMFDADKDLQGEEVGVEKEVTGKDVSDVKEINVSSIATFVTATTPIIFMDEITLAKALIEIKTSMPMAKGICFARAKLNIYTNTNSFFSTTIKEIAQKSSSKRAGDELDQERSKKQKIEDENESAELKRCLEIVLNAGDDVSIDATPLSSKSPTTVDYKIYKEGRKSFF